MFKLLRRKLVWVLLGCLLLAGCAGNGLKVQRGQNNMPAPAKIAVVALNQPQVADQVVSMLVSHGVILLNRRQTEILGGKNIRPGEELVSPGPLDVFLASGVDALMFIKTTTAPGAKEPDAIQAEIVSLDGGLPLYSVVWTNKFGIVPGIEPKNRVQLGQACQLVAEEIRNYFSSARPIPKAAQESPHASQS